MKIVRTKEFIEKISKKWICQVHIQIKKDLKEEFWKNHKFNVLTYWWPNKIHIEILKFPYSLISKEFEVVQKNYLKAIDEDNKENQSKCTIEMRKLRQEWKELSNEWKYLEETINKIWNLYWYEFFSNFRYWEDRSPRF